MIEMKVKNSSNKLTGGNITIDEKQIIIQHQYKPELIIDDDIIIEQCLQIHKNNNKDTKDFDKDTIIKLFDYYQLTIAEISTLFNVKYYIMNNFINKLNIKTSNREGRRNSNYSVIASQEKLEKLSNSHKGQISWNKGIPVPEKQRIKISETLKQKYIDGELTQDGIKQSLAWKNDRYKNVTFDNGYTGYFTSIKYNATFCFRSLLELAYFIKWETDNYYDVKSEPIIIPIIYNGKESCYIPDAIIDNTYLIEIKPKTLLEKPRNKKDKERQEAEFEYAIKYAKDNNLIFTICTDEDIHFRWDSYKRYLNKNLDLINKHNIIFTNKNPIKQISKVEVEDK